MFNASKGSRYTVYESSDKIIRTILILIIINNILRHLNHTKACFLETFSIHTNENRKVTIILNTVYNETK